MRHHVVLTVLVCATLLYFHPVLALFPQQGQKFVGAGTMGTSGQGDSVSSPTLIVNPSTGTQLTAFTVTGSNYTPNGTVSLFVQIPGQAWQQVGFITATAAGTITMRWPFLPGCSFPAGTAHAYAVDATTNQTSPTTTEQISSDPSCAALDEIVVRDIFGRRLNENGLALVDWEGYMANPAIKFFVVPPANAVFPATAVLSADNDRLYFDLPSQVGAGGPTKTISFANASTEVPIYISSFPDRDANDGHYHLTIQFTSADNQQTSLTLSVHEIDQDTAGTGPYSVTVDFSKDQTGFFLDTRKTGIIQQVADDWAYFVDDMHLDQVPAGAEVTFIWDPTGFMTGNYTTNSLPYTGYLLYSYGIHSSALRSGGEPSAVGGLQSSGGSSLPLRRSGGYESETQGNFNTLGWFLTTGDDDWWVSGNRGNEQNDLSSIAHHEIGHAFIFNPAQPNFYQFKQLGFVQDAAVLAYHGSYPRIDASDHLSGEVDNASRRGAFGYEYFGDVPQRRWLITKLDLLVAQAVGYAIRRTSAFVPLTITTTSLASGSVSRQYGDTARASGGIPFYHWTLAAGALPEGLSLNPFTGVISGVPIAPGTFGFTLCVQEYVEGTIGVTLPLAITIAPPLPPTVLTGVPNGVSTGSTISR